VLGLPGCTGVTWPIPRSHELEQGCKAASPMFIITCHSRPYALRSTGCARSIRQVQALTCAHPILNSHVRLGLLVALLQH